MLSKQRYNMKKLKMKIAKITPETNRNDITTYRIKVESGGKIYEFAVREDEYLNEEKRARFHARFFKTIRRSQEATMQSSIEKENKTKKRDSLIGKEVKEDE